MKALRTIAVDDEPLALERLCELVRGTQGLTLVGQAQNGLEALDLIASVEPDLIFIDVEMPELSGFGVVAALDGQRIPGIVFVTAFEEYALRAFDVGAIDYLHKPLTKARFAAAVDRARQRLERTSEIDWRTVPPGAARLERQRGLRTRFVVRRGNSHHFVRVGDVDWVDVADNYVQLHVGEQGYLVRGTMNDLDEELDPLRFVRIHRSTLVATDRIVSIQPRESGGYVVELRTGIRLNSSRGYADRVRALLCARNPRSRTRR
ncbi:MAG TPA: LytTR family DNA-binding domain-containing protein [Vicinamibacterales bacterium]|jgi:two-component system LytT family response regulator|nr:LytTR family DNA-binding domain-containing protein [Vicinamibacterales bacterium]